MPDASTYEVGDRVRRVGGRFDRTIGDVVAISDEFADTYVVRFPLVADGVLLRHTVDRLLHRTNLEAVTA